MFQKYTVIMSGSEIQSHDQRFFSDNQYVGEFQIHRGLVSNDAIAHRAIEELCIKEKTTDKAMNAVAEVKCVQAADGIYMVSCWVDGAVYTLLAIQRH